MRVRSASVIAMAIRHRAIGQTRPASTLDRAGECWRSEGRSHSVSGGSGPPKLPTTSIAPGSMLVTGKTAGVAIVPNHSGHHLDPASQSAWFVPGGPLWKKGILPFVDLSKPRARARPCLGSSASGIPPAPTSFGWPRAGGSTLACGGCGSRSRPRQPPATKGHGFASEGSRWTPRSVIVEVRIR